MGKHKRSKSARSPTPEKNFELFITPKRHRSAFEHAKDNSLLKRSPSPESRRRKEKQQSKSSSGHWKVDDVQSGKRKGRRSLDDDIAPRKQESRKNRTRSGGQIESHSESPRPGKKQKVDSDVDDALLKSFRIIPLSDSDQIIIILDHPESLTLKGKVNLKCICGTVNVYGYEVKPTGDTLPLMSSDTHSLLSITTTKGHKGNIMDSPQLKKIIAENKIERKELKSCKDPVVILLSKLEWPEMEFLSSLTPFQSLFSADWRSRSDVVDLEGVDIRLYGPDAGVPKLVASKEFHQITKWIKPRLEAGEKPIIVVCGGKNVGKSTLTRFLINTALNHVESVMYLECDVGQTEFTPPSCVSLCKVDQPLLGPPFSHQRKTESCCFVGCLSPADDPEYYMNCVSSVVTHFLDTKQQYPLIVNTMGWNKGMGLSLMTDTLRLVKPDLVIQIDSKSHYKNFPLISGDFVAQSIGWTTRSVELVETMKQHSLISVNCVPETEEIVPVDKYRPVDHRTLSLITHLSQSEPSIGSLQEYSARPPYVVPWSSVAVHIVHAAVPDSQIMYALNASVVALCIVDTNLMVSTDEEGYPKFLHKTPVCSCLGFGVIRGIDPEKKVFYLQTPLSQEELSRVNCLMKGAVELPQQFLLSQKVTVPYVGAPKDVIGASSISKRKHTIRRRPDNAR